jgi:hypothetical protein
MLKNGPITQHQYSNLVNQNTQLTKGTEHKINEGNRIHN